MTWYYIAIDQRDGSVQSARTVMLTTVEREAARHTTVGTGVAHQRAQRQALIAAGVMTGVDRAFGCDYRYVREDLLTASDVAALATSGIVVTA